MINIYYSENGEEYRHDDIDEAIYAIIENSDELELGAIISVWEGTCNLRKASTYANNVFDDMANNAYDELPDFADDWPNVDKDVQVELLNAVNDAIDSWADKHKQQPKFGLMKNCKERFFKITKTSNDTSEIRYTEWT